MKKTTKFLIHLFVFMMLVLPIVSLAATDPAPIASDSGLVGCKDNCGWKELMNMINNIIQFILFKMAIPISAIMFAYAGFKLVTAGSDAPEARNQAKSIFSNTAMGLVFAAASWLIIRTILGILGWNGSWIGFNPF